MLFEYIIASFPFSAVKRAYFRLARMLLWSAETARGAPEIARQIRDGRAPKLRSPSSRMARYGPPKEPIIFSGDCPRVMTDQGFACHDH